MKIKKILSFILLLICFFAKAQVGIGTTSPNAQLDISSSNQATPANTDGILIPKVDTFPATNPTASQQAMLVYLTTTTTFAAVSRAPGFYYWDNTTTNWISIQTTSGWNLIGNSGTSSTTNFMGSTDDKDVVFRRNNIRAGFIGNPNTASGNMNTSFGANSLLNPTGTRNVAIGTGVLTSDAAGNTNTAVGERAMNKNTTGSYNAAFGTGTLFTNVNGDFNTAIGRNSLTSNSSGANNTALGYNSGYTSIGSNNIFIGNQAGYNETGSNKLYIEYAALTTDSSQNNAILYGDFGVSPKVLRANAQLQIGNPALTGYALPTSRGTAGQILQTDGVGGTSWVDTATNISLVRTNLSANQSLGTGGWQKLNFNTVAFDTKSEFNTGTNRFVALKAGYYEVNAGLHTDSQSNTQYYSIAIYKNGTEYQETTANHSGLGPVYRTINATLYLAANDYVEIYAQNYQSGVNIDNYSGKTYFEVKQLK